MAAMKVFVVVILTSDRGDFPRIIVIALLQIFMFTTVIKENFQSYDNHQQHTMFYIIILKQIVILTLTAKMIVSMIRSCS